MWVLSHQEYLLIPRQSWYLTYLHAVPPLFVFRKYPLFKSLVAIQLRSNHQCISLEQVQNVNWSSDKVYIKNEVYWHWCQTQCNVLCCKEGKVKSQGQYELLKEGWVLRDDRRATEMLVAFGKSMQELRCEGRLSGRTGASWPTGMNNQKPQFKDHYYSEWWVFTQDKKHFLSPPRVMIWTPDLYQLGLTSCTDNFLHLSVSEISGNELK